MQPWLKIPISPERAAFARWLLIVTAAFGLIVSVLDYRQGNLIVASVGAAAVIILPLCILLSERFDRPTWLPRIALVTLGVFLAIGNHTQLHLPEKMVWLMAFPLVFYYLAGPRLGTVLTVAGGLDLLLAYVNYPMGLAVEPAFSKAFSQTLLAYCLIASLAFLHERLRTNQEALLRLHSESDALTGLLNRRGFKMLADAAWARARRLQEPIAFILLDIDHFKHINDDHGHEVGDRVLQEVAQRISLAARQSDLIGRWGGEEFVVLLHGTDLAGANLFAERMRQSLADAPHPEVGRVSASFGVAATATLDDDFERLLKLADQALYRAKLQGRNQVICAPITDTPLTSAA